MNPLALMAAASDLSTFGNDPLWLTILKVFVLFVSIIVFVVLLIWFERRAVSWMQMRVGPNRTGPQGILQALADALKLLFKEEIFPNAADKAVYIIAPIISGMMAFMSFAVIPLGPEVTIFGHKTALQISDFPISVLFVLAISSMAIYGIVLGGWSSGSTYSLLGALRSSAQMISYEIPMGLSFVAVFLYSGTVSTSQIVAAQERVWYALLLFPSFVIYVIAMFGETNRAPFDMPEGESEIVGGYLTEYSSFKFAMFYLGEYIGMVTVSAVATTLFLGGWRAPWPLSMWDGANQGWWPLLWFVGKLVILLFVFVWVRGTLPRYRYDQFMKFGWKVLLPVSIGWIIVVATARGLRNVYQWDANATLMRLGIPIVAVLVIITLLDEVRGRRKPTKSAAAIVPPFDAYAGGHPVPPLPGQQFTGGAVASPVTKQEVPGA